MNPNRKAAVPMRNKPICMIRPMGMEESNTAESEKGLWIAVLNQAVKDARSLVQKVEKNPNLWGNPLFRFEVLHLKRYFLSRSMDPGGFGFICDLMNVDSEHAARRIDEKYLRRLTPVTT